jgi:hypothetical protein
MNNKVNKKKLSLKEIYASGPSFMGCPSFDGGYFGFGGDRQIAKKDPEVERIRQETEGEVNQNVQDQNWTMGKNNWEKHLNMQDVHTKNIEDQKDLPMSRVTEDRSLSDANYTDLPGSPAMNIVPASKLFVPGAGRPDGTEEYLLDDDPNSNEEGIQFTNTRVEPEPAKFSPDGGMGIVLQPKQFIPNDEPPQGVFVNHEAKYKKTKKIKNTAADEKQLSKTNIEDNIKNIKKYLKVLLASDNNKKPSPFLPKLEQEINKLQKKLNISEHSITLTELMSIINEVINEELSNKND